MTSPAQPCVRGCTLHNQHYPDCARPSDDECGGCLPRPGNPVWCDSCTDRIRDSLGDIPDLTLAVAARRDGRLNTPGDPTIDVNSAPTRDGSPSGSPAWDAADEAINWAWSWAEALADHLRHHGPMRYTPAGTPARNLTATIAYLRAQLAVALTSPFADDFGREVLETRRGLQYLSGQERLTHRLKDRCPSCDQKTLTREDGADRVECQGCGRIWTEDEYAHLAHVAAAS